MYEQINRIKTSYKNRILRKILQKDVLKRINRQSQLTSVKEDGEGGGST